MKKNEIRFEMGSNERALWGIKRDKTEERHLH